MHRGHVDETLDVLRDEMVMVAEMDAVSTAAVATPQLVLEYSTLAEVLLRQRQALMDKFASRLRDVLSRLELHAEGAEGAQLAAEEAEPRQGEEEYEEAGAAELGQLAERTLS